jgi:hypothetical protein
MKRGDAVCLCPTVHDRHSVCLSSWPALRAMRTRPHMHTTHTRARAPPPTCTPSDTTLHQPQAEQTLYILGRLLGGGKKRKKKTYTKPKKQKHKHKKVKLRVLKFYKVCGSWCVMWGGVGCLCVPCAGERVRCVWGRGRVAQPLLCVCVCGRDICACGDAAPSCACAVACAHTQHTRTHDNPTGGRLWQGHAPAEAVPQLRPGHLHGVPL